MDKKKIEQGAKTMFYGRARRIELIKKVCVVGALLIFAILVVFFLFSRFSKSGKKVEDFYYLKNYFVSKNYTCERIEQDGGRCYYNNDEMNLFYSFTRYDDGYVYLIRSNSYSLIFRHILDTYNKIEFSTNSNALMGSRNKDYVCYTKEDLVGELDYCETSSGEKLENETYKGAIRLAISNLNEIIYSSGYNRDKLVQDYIWSK